MDKIYFLLLLVIAVYFHPSVRAQERPRTVTRRGKRPPGMPFSIRRGAGRPPPPPQPLYGPNTRRNPFADFAQVDNGYLPAQYHPPVLTRGNEGSDIPKSRKWKPTEPPTVPPTPPPTKPPTTTTTTTTTTTPTTTTTTTTTTTPAPTKPPSIPIRTHTRKWQPNNQPAYRPRDPYETRFASNNIPTTTKKPLPVVSIYDEYGAPVPQPDPQPTIQSAQKAQLPSGIQYPQPVPAQTQAPVPAFNVPSQSFRPPPPPPLPETQSQTAYQVSSGQTSYSVSGGVPVTSNNVASSANQYQSGLPASSQGALSSANQYQAGPSASSQGGSKQLAFLQDFKEQLDLFAKQLGVLPSSSGKTKDISAGQSNPSTYQAGQNIISAERPSSVNAYPQQSVPQNQWQSQQANPASTQVTQGQEYALPARNEIQYRTNTQQVAQNPNDNRYMAKPKISDIPYVVGQTESSASIEYNQYNQPGNANRQGSNPSRKDPVLYKPSVGNDVRSGPGASQGWPLAQGQTSYIGQVPVPVLNGTVKEYSYASGSLSKSRTPDRSVSGSEYASKPSSYTNRYDPSAIESNSRPTQYDREQVDSTVQESVLNNYNQNNGNLRQDSERLARLQARKQYDQLSTTHNAKRPTADKAGWGTVGKGNEKGLGLPAYSNSRAGVNMYPDQPGRTPSLSSSGARQNVDKSLVNEYGSWREDPRVGYKSSNVGSAGRDLSTQYADGLDASKASAKSNTFGSPNVNKRTGNRDDFVRSESRLLNAQKSSDMYAMENGIPSKGSQKEGPSVVYDDQYNRNNFASAQTKGNTREGRIDVSESNRRRNRGEYPSGQPEEPSMAYVDNGSRHSLSKPTSQSSSVKSQTATHDGKRTLTRDEIIALLKRRGLMVGDNTPTTASPSTKQSPGSRGNIGQETYRSDAYSAQSEGSNDRKSSPKFSSAFDRGLPDPRSGNGRSDVSLPDSKYGGIDYSNTAITGGQYGRDSPDSPKTNGRVDNSFGNVRSQTGRDIPDALKSNGRNEIGSGGNGRDKPESRGANSRGEYSPNEFARQSSEGSSSQYGLLGPSFNKGERIHTNVAARTKPKVTFEEPSAMSDQKRRGSPSKGIASSVDVNEYASSSKANEYGNSDVSAPVGSLLGGSGGPIQERCPVTPVCGTDGFTYMSECFLWNGIKKDCEGFCPCRSKSATAASSAASKPSVIAAAAIVTTKPTPVYKPKPVPTQGSKVYNPEFQLPVQAPALTVRAYPNAASAGAFPAIKNVVKPVPQYIPPMAPPINDDSVASIKAYDPPPTVVQSSNNVAVDAVVAVDKSVVQGPPPARVQALQARQVAMAARGAPPPNKPPPDCKCPPIYRPVCGVRGATYDNDCYRRCSNERKACNGECPCTGQPHSLGHTLKAEVAVPASEPITSGDGYHNQNLNHERSYQPALTCECTRHDIDPVCTTDGQTEWFGCLAICLGKTVACSSECPC